MCSKYMLAVTAGLVLALVSESAAKTVTGSPGKTANETSVIGVAGPAPKKPAAETKSAPQPSKKELKKVKITPPPPMHALTWARLWTPSPPRSPCPR